MTWRRSLLVVLLVGLVVLASGCSDSGNGVVPAVLGVVIDQGDVELTVGAEVLLTVTVDVVGGASSAVEWSSSDPDVAAVSVAGLVMSEGVGECVITAVSEVDATKSSSVTVTVVEGAAMVIKVDTTLADDARVTLPLRGVVDVLVDWGDGSSASVVVEGDVSHEYDAEGEYVVTVSGSLEWFGNGAGAYPDADKITGVLSWGDLGLTSLSGAFRNATNLTTVPVTIPPTVTDTSHMLGGATVFNQDISSWDVSNVTTMSWMFGSATAFNQDIGSWEVSNVTSFHYTFFNTQAFDQAIGSWDVSGATSMWGMFYAAAAFNQDIGDWDVSNVRVMNQLFGGTGAFDQDIGGWDVSGVTDMWRMFDGASVFNQDVGGWDVSGVSDMVGMFKDAEAFNQDLSGWCVQEIDEEPFEFDAGAVAWTLLRPVWGTCP